MKKVITAIGNPYYNIELNKEKDIEVIGRDIQYKEAILEVLEKNKDINYIVISEKISGNISMETLIKKIKFNNKKIKIIFLLLNKNEKKERFLKELGISKIYYLKKINIKNLSDEINKNNNIKKEKDLETKRKNKIITITGFKGVGKTTITFLITRLLIRKSKKILIININKKKQKKYIKLLKNKNREYIETSIKDNLFLIYNFNKFLKNNKKNIKDIWQELIEKYEYILIDMEIDNNKEWKKTIFDISKKIIFIFNNNFFELNNYIEEKKTILNKDKILFIQNKYGFNFFNYKIIEKIINKKILKIKFNKKIINNILENRKVGVNIIIKYYLYNIIKKLEIFKININNKKE